MCEKVILVNDLNEVIGEKEKIQAHIEGALHRAFSVFLFNSDSELLLQKRAGTKYHSKGLWSNTCCGHPRPGEDTKDGAHRRLREEMGIDCQLGEIFSFTYRVVLDNHLVEHEFDHVFIGIFDGEPILNKEEGEDWMWIDLKSLKQGLANNPNTYSFWLRACIDRVIDLYACMKTQG
jgi:isopentenyl-diphosphate delta-isomerase